MSVPKVSIIVPIYNVEAYLQRCMDSLLNQTLNDIEIILVDDGSPDNCAAMCDAYTKLDARVKVIHKKNEGLGLARNSGLEIATGEYIAFVDSDDFVKRTMYEELYNEAILKDADAVFCNFFAYTTKHVIKEVVEVPAYHCFEGKEEVTGFLLDMVGAMPSHNADRKYSMSVWRAIYRHRTIKFNQLLFPSERKMISEDIVFHIQLLSKMRKIVYLPTCNYYYCENGASLSKSFRSDRFDKYKELHKALMVMLTGMDILDKTRVSLAVDRLFIGYVRNMLLVGNNGNEVIRYVLEDDYFRAVVNRYPYKGHPFKHRLFLMLTKHRQSRLIKILSKK